MASKERRRLLYKRPRFTRAEAGRQALRRDSLLNAGHDPGAPARYQASGGENVGGGQGRHALRDGYAAYVKFLDRGRHGRFISVLPAAASQVRRELTVICVGGDWPAALLPRSGPAGPRFSFQSGYCPETQLKGPFGKNLLYALRPCAGTMASAGTFSSKLAEPARRSGSQEPCHCRCPQDQRLSGALFETRSSVDAVTT